MMLLLVYLLQYHTLLATSTFASQSPLGHANSEVTHSVAVPTGDRYFYKRDAAETIGGSGSSVRRDDLEADLQNITSYTTIRLEPGNHTIESFILVTDVTGVAIEGDSSEGGVVIHCSEGAGLAFINVSQLSIRNVTIDGCGFNGTDTEQAVDILDDIVSVFYNIPVVVRIAVLIGHCENVTMESVTIKNTRGFGLVGINIIGSSLLQSVVFFNNTNAGVCSYNVSVRELIDTDSRDHVGGAAIFMYFDYLDRFRHQGKTFNLKVHNCTFKENTECSVVYLNYLRPPGRGESQLVREAGYRIGGSAGFTLALAQQTYGVNVVTTSSVFYNNIATLGGGYLIALFEGVRDTHVKVEDCLFGGSSIAFMNDVRLPENVDYNTDLRGRDATIDFVNSTFQDNVITTRSSSLLVYSNYYLPVRDVNDAVSVRIKNCLFTRNLAFVGSAMVIYEYKLGGLNIGLQVSIEDTDFVDNGIVTIDTDAVITVSQSAGIVDIRHTNVTFYGNCSFVGNGGTALRAEASLVGISGNVTFLRNTGVNGGALYLVEYSYLIMNRNSSIYFIDNEARIGGGAIFVNENGLNSYVVGGFADCFLHFAYDNFVVCENCSDLNEYGVYIKFLDNFAQYSGSMVSGSALLTCPWAYDLLQREDQNRSVFEILYEEYPEVFDFDEPPNNPRLVQSAAAKLEVQRLDESDSNIYEVFPGQTFNVRVSAIDDFNNIISNVVAGFASPNTFSENSTNLITPLLSSNVFAVLTENEPTIVPITVLAAENQTVDVVIYSTELAGRAQQQITVKLFSCGFGFVFDPVGRDCTCDMDLLNTNLGIHCNQSSQIIVPDGVWIGPSFTGDDIVVHRCVSLNYCSPGQRSIEIHSPNDTDIDFDVQCDADMNRVGFLCGRCKDGYSAILGSRRCKQCSNWYILLFPIFIAVGILTIVTITYLNITITTGLINGAIFYSNIVSIYGAILVPGETLTNGAIALVSFPTLNLGFETCLHDRMNDLEKVWWQLSFPLYLFILIGATTCLARTKCLKFNRSAGFSTIQAFATLLVLCYISVLEVCIELIGFRSITTIKGRRFVQWISDPTISYFGSHHRFLGLVAFVLIVLYLIPLPFFLLFPSTLYKNKYLSKFIPIYDAFWDPFKPRCRFFLGFRLMFRWLPFALGFLVRSPINIFVTNFLLILLLALQVALQPFREKWNNNVDVAFLLNLILLFSGSVFFWSEYNGADPNDRSSVSNYGAIYSNVFISIGFLFMVIIILHRLILRSATLRKILGRCLSKTRLSKVYNFRPVRERSNATPSTAISENDASEVNFSEVILSGPEQNGRHRPVYGASELREPLLESGVADIVHLDPSSVPVRTQTVHKIN